MDASRRNFVIGVVAVAATYVYFLLFAEFAFLRLAAAGGPPLRPLMAVLGASGILGSVAAAALFRRESFVPRLSAWLAACGFAAAAALVGRDAAGFFGAAALTGFALGAATVTLSAGLKSLLGAQRLGFGVGLGTGLAYAVSNIPRLFAADPRQQAIVCIAIVLVAALLVRAARPVALLAPSLAPARLGPWRATLLFLALVWMDSAAFYVIQNTPELHGPTWSGDRHLWLNAGVHLAAALASGWLLDRGALRIAGYAAWVALVIACLGLTAPQPSGQLSFAYAAGVSLYSAALVWYPASAGRPWVAALVFAVAGWIGSALGIGMAQDLHGIPRLFGAIAGIAIVVAFGWSRRSAAPALVLCVALQTITPTAFGADEPELRGREVYIAEGCINCHSQYVRPQVPLDVERWGPATTPADLAAQQPPLPGNRRQGPDLANVGLRRSSEWNRLHLLAPRRVSPGSRMPSYAHLFADDTRGEDLLAYLSGLGLERGPERAATVAAWQPRASVAVKPAQAARVFRQLCAPCHGPRGTGDGPLAPQLSLRPPDWTQGGGWRHSAGDPVALARIVKFGLPGSPMAGHEALDDATVLGLVELVRSFAAAPLPTPPAR